MLHFANSPTLEPDDRAAAGRIIARGIPPRLRPMVQEWSDLCGVSVAQIMGHSRRQQIAHARQGVYWLLMHRGGLSVSAIGRAMGRDHTTVQHGIAAETRRRNGEGQPG